LTENAGRYGSGEGVEIGYDEELMVAQMKIKMVDFDSRDEGKSSKSF
jgi:hypothetical protein